MIAFLEGDLVEALPTQVTLAVNGVGYAVHVPLSSFAALPPVNQRVRLLTHFVVREDAQQLFGFLTNSERELFLLLIGHVSGVGPKIALAVLSGMSVENFKAAVARGEVAALSKVKGVGKKTAERMILELKDKVGVAAAWEAAVQGKTDGRMNDAMMALLALGFKQVEAQKALREVQTQDGAASTEEMIRRALQALA